MKYYFFVSVALSIFLCAACVYGQIGGQPSVKTVSMNGKLLQASGKPLAYTEIELVPVTAKKQINDARLLATTSASGLFSFFDVPGGSYTLSINFDEKPTDTSPYLTCFYPNTNDREKAEVFKIDAATRLKGIVFQLPPKLAQRKITGKVVGTDGKPVADVFVWLKDIQYDDLSLDFRNKTDKNGNFTLSGFESRKYVILAALFDAPPSIYAPPDNPLAVGEMGVFILDANTAVFKIILKDTGRKSEIY